MRKRTKWILAIIGVIVLVLILASVFGKSSGDEVRVTAETVTRSNITEIVTASGKIYPEVEVKITSDIAGEVTAIEVQEGDSVRQGQILARIFAENIETQRDEVAARVAQSEAGVANSEAATGALRAQMDQDRRNYERNQKLYEDKVISKAELERFETAYRTSQAQYNAALQNIRSLRAGTRSTRTSLEAANLSLSRATLRSPMNGIVSSLTIKEGERVSGSSFSLGTELMRIANMNALEVRVEVGENDIVKLSVGDSADVEIEAYNNRKFTGVVTQIASSSGGAGAALQQGTASATNYEVRIRLDPASYADLRASTAGKGLVFRPGMNANVEIKTDRRNNVLSVPIGAVAARIQGSDEERKKSTDQPQDAPADNRDLEEVVFVIDSAGTARKRVVKTGIQDMTNIEILSGLKPGDRVITGPFDVVNQSLKTGQKVLVVKPEELFEEKK